MNWRESQKLRERSASRLDVTSIIELNRRKVANTVVFTLKIHVTATADVKSRSLGTVVKDPACCIGCNTHVFSYVAQNSMEFSIVEC